MEWKSSNVMAGDDVLAKQYNDLRDDVATVLDSSVPVATVVLWAGNSGNLNTGWLVCDGSAISRSTYSVLYSKQGNTFGAGNGSTTFNLPDMRDRFVVGAGSSYSQNSKGGDNTVNTSHSHTVNSHSHSVASHGHTVNSHRHYVGGHTHSAGGLVGLANFQNDRAYMYSVGTGGWGANIANYTGGSHSNTFLSYRGMGIIGSTGGEAAGYSDYQSPGTSATGTVYTGSTSPGTTTAGSTTLENRPPYIGIFYIIKAL